MMKECLAMLMVGGKEHATLFQEVRSWAVRNEARLCSTLVIDPKGAACLEHERARWNMLIEIFSSIAQENLVEQNEK